MKKKCAIRELDGAALIAAERKRHVTEEGYDAEHDACHEGGELAIAAACYAVNDTDANCLHVGCGMVEDAWPWDKKFDKRGKQDRIRELVKAGALVAAEIDRLQRLKK